jgi:cytochrome c oxidase assembly protein subunit 15
LAATLAMFPLIWMGGLVTSKGAGMSVPDWPNTFGYNMFAVPWEHWIGAEAGGVFYEHAHRLLGTIAGFCALAAVLAAFGVARKPERRKRLVRATLVLGGLAVASYVAMKLVPTYAVAKGLGHVVSTFAGLALVTGVAATCRTKEPRVWRRWLAVGLLVAVCIQGLLGGLRVVMVELDLAIVHGIFGQLTLCMGGLLVLASTRWWEATARERSPAGVGLAWGASAVFVLCVGQLVVAAIMRHYDAGLAVPDFPLHFGQVAPPTDAAGLAEANAYRLSEHWLAPVTLGEVWLHVTHRIGALLITVAVAWLTVSMWRARAMRGHAVLLASLVLVQVALGVATVWLAKPADVATAHVATGATLLLTSALLAGRLLRQYGWRIETRRTAAPQALPTAAVAAT